MCLVGCIMVALLLCQRVPRTFGSPCAARVVLNRSKGYDATVAAAPATAPLAKDTAALLLPADAKDMQECTYRVCGHLLEEVPCCSQVQLLMPGWRQVVLMMLSLCPKPSAWLHHCCQPLTQPPHAAANHATICSCMDAALVCNTACVHLQLVNCLNQVMQQVVPHIALVGISVQPTCMQSCMVLSAPMQHEAVSHLPTPA